MANPNKIVINSGSRALLEIGDRWTQFIIREAFLGAKRFETFRQQTGAARSTLSQRLKKLEENKILARTPYQKSPERFEYHLTEKGLSLYPFILMLWKWELRWDKNSTALPQTLLHKICSHQTIPLLTCTHCHEEITLSGCTFEDGPGAGFETAPSGRTHRRFNTQTGQGGLHPLEAIDLLGDRWSVLTISTQFFGRHRFDEIQRDIGIASNILANRLQSLVRAGIFERRQYQARPARYEYWLTEKGKDTYPIAFCLMLWGDRWFADEAGPPTLVTHKNCGKTLGAELTCGECRETIFAQDIGFERPAHPAPQQTNTRLEDT